MWNEPSPSIASLALNEEFLENDPQPAIISSVEINSIGEALGFEAGDKLLKINGIKPRDLIDYQYLIAEEKLNLEVIDSEGKIHKIALEKDTDEGLGLSFKDALFDGLKECNNNCPFCFIDQQPKGRRKTLYLKDDDYRMSFLYGSYLTLTNLLPNDWIRIEQQRLSPLFVSIHSTDSKLRAKLLKNTKAGKIMEQIKWFAERKLQIHAQIVVCPGLNDGKNLEKTLNDLFEYADGEFPTVCSAAVVPVGLTRFRPSNDGLKQVDEKSAKQVINLVEKLQEDYQIKIGTRFAWLSDEWYLLAKKPLPQRGAYEDLPQEENGVGSIRSFLEKLEKATSQLPRRISANRICTWVVGKLVEEALSPISERMNKIEGLTLRIHGLSSPYWGKEQVVTGLITGKDVIDGLRNQELGDEILLPSVMLKYGESRFLDDITIEEVEKTLQVPITVITDADDFVKKVIGKRSHE